jgi:hypothetical protein
MATRHIRTAIRHIPTDTAHTAITAIPTRPIITAIRTRLTITAIQHTATARPTIACGGTIATASFTTLAFADAQHDPEQAARFSRAAFFASLETTTYDLVSGVET